jgi:hypothetical protein
MVKLNIKNQSIYLGYLMLINMTAHASDEFTPEVGYPDADSTDAIHN